VSETDTTTAPADTVDRRFASRKWRLTLLLIAMVTVPFALGLMSVELWVGSLMAMQLVYMGGNVGGRLADGVVSLIAAALAKANP
jgi:hypothetical protein